MSKWPTMLLGQVSTIHGGNSAPQGKDAFKNGVLPFIRTSDVGEIHIGEIGDSRDHLPSESISSFKVFEPGAVLIPKSGASTFTNHRVITTVRAAVSSHLAVVVSDPAKLDPHFCYYVLQQLDARSLVQDQSYPSLGLGDIAGVAISLPPLDEQKRIVAKLDGVVEHSRQLHAISARRHEKAESLASSIRASLLAPGRGWDLKSLKDVATIFDGPHATARKTKSGPWYLSIASLRDGELDMSKSAHLSESDFPAWTKRTEVLPGDTLFSYETRLGQAALWQRTEPAALGRRMGLMRPNASILPEFLTASYLGPGFQEQIRQRTTEGATVDRIPIANMGDWPIWVPSLDQQRELVDHLRELTDLLRAQAIISLAKASKLIDLRVQIVSSVLSDAP